MDTVREPIIAQNVAWDGFPEFRYVNLSDEVGKICGIPLGLWHSDALATAVQHIGDDTLKTITAINSALGARDPLGNLYAIRTFAHPKMNHRARSLHISDTSLVACRTVDTAVMESFALSFVHRRGVTQLETIVRAFLCLPLKQPL